MNTIINFFHNLFIPKEENNFRAKALHPDFLSYYLIFALVLTFSLKQFNLTNVLGFATDISLNKLYELTNIERQKSNLPSLTYNEKLSQAAALKAQSMLSNNYWAHFGPNGESPWDFILKTGYQYEFAGENLAKNFLFSQGVIDGWMNSQTHKDNILKKDYSEVGFAIVNGTLNNEPTTLVVQLFAKPLTGEPIIQSFVPPSVQAEEPVQKPIPAQLESIQSNPIPVKNSVKPIITIIPHQSILTQESSSFKIPLFNIAWNLNFVFIAFLLIALVMDLYFASKFHVIHMGGKNIAHIIFIGFICFGLLLFSKGSIL